VSKYQYLYSYLRSGTKTEAAVARVTVGLKAIESIGSKEISLPTNLMNTLF